MQIEFNRHGARSLEERASLLVSEMLGRPLKAFYQKTVQSSGNDLSWTFLRLNEQAEFGFRILYRDSGRSVLAPGMQDLTFISILESRQAENDRGELLQVTEGLYDSHQLVGWEFLLTQTETSCVSPYVVQILSPDLQSVTRCLGLFGSAVPKQERRGIGRARIGLLTAHCRLNEPIRIGMWEEVSLRNAELKTSLFFEEEEERCGLLRREQGQFVYVCKEDAMSSCEEFTDEPGTIVVSIEIGEIEVPVKEALSLRPGDALCFQAPEAAFSAMVRLGGRQWGSAQLEFTPDGCRVQISEIYDFSAPLSGNDVYKGKESPQKKTD
jgi:hypothetical protein